MSTLNMKDTIELTYGMYVTVAGIVVFTFLNKLVKFIGPPKNLKNTKDAEYRWRNVFVSYTHALFISGWAFTSTLLYPELVYDLISHINYFTYFCVCFTTGYFTYDLLDNTISGNFFTNWEVSLHHIANLSVFYCNIYLKQNIGFNILALYLEINTIFLHWRKLLQMTREPFSSRKYIVIKHLNILSVIFFRFPATFLISWAVYAFNDRAPPFLVALVAVACPFMHILNSVVLYRLVKSDLLRGADGKPSSVMSTLRRDWEAIVKGGLEPDRVVNNNANGYSVVNGHGLKNGQSHTITSDTDTMSNGHHKSS